jgi:putative ABC transport system permease protein
MSLAGDVRYAWRSLKRSPAFAATAIVTIALGIGASAAVFSLVNAVLLKPVPIDEPERVVMLMLSANRNPLIAASSPAQFMHFKEHGDVLEDVAAFTSVSLNFGSADTGVRLAGARVSEAYFRVFRFPFAAGRGFTAQEDLPGGERVVVVSHGFWTRRLGADPAIVGKTIEFSGDAFTVVGVGSPHVDLRELGDPEVWIPLQADPSTTDRPYLYQVAARLVDGVTLAQAQERLESSVAAFRDRFPGVLGPRAGFSALVLRDAVVGQGVTGTLFVLLGAVSLVLLIACGNVASLLLVRANVRRREMAVRSALGAGRSRLARQLLTESALLAAAGGALGVVVGFWAIRALLAIDTAGLPRVGDAGALIGLDWRVVSFSLLLSLATVLLFGLAPALASSRANLAEVVRGLAGGVGGGARQARARSVLIAGQVALAVVLLIGAALLIRTSIALNRVDPGFNTEGLLTMRTSLSGSSFASTESVARTVAAVREGVRSVPGVEEVVATSSVPMQPGWGLPFNIPGRVDEGLYTGSNPVVFTFPGYFAAFDIPLVQGRAFTDGDDAAAAPVVIINEALARRHWPDGANPLDGELLIGGGAANMREFGSERPRRVVGIVGDVRTGGLATEPEPVMYVPRAQLSDEFNALIGAALPMTWVVRTQGDPLTVSRAVQGEIARATGTAVTEVRTMADVVARSASRQRLYTLLMSVFAGSALLLAAVGVYGVVAYAVQSRTRELGVRLALGAQAWQIGALVMRDGMLLIVTGTAAGLVAALFLTSVLASALYGVQPRDPAAFVGAPLALALVAFAAIWAAARRARSVDPISALRCE